MSEMDNSLPARENKADKRVHTLKHTHTVGANITLFTARLNSFLVCLYPWFSMESPSAHSDTWEK